jgi:hypothetical protein
MFHIFARIKAALREWKRTQERRQRRASITTPFD